jgi:hypothetical protein
MRLAGRFSPRESILGAVETLELVEAYPDDKYLPNYLALGRASGEALHVLVAVDVEGDNVRVVTANLMRRSRMIRHVASIEEIARAADAVMVFGSPGSPGGTTNSIRAEEA